ncbi:hypothetical protein FE257_007364 [Aspergillus nanangensis]|uniref:EthD domain-containing protein n=1 Tax=Aspergillus nanangensis TaxID=2582783 RepID=A0AAD4CNB8_ASPNN|nr:hypothetical protein FE257_007364 [Aspergillus nanangensis]
MTFQKIDHQFTYPSLSYTAEPNFQPAIKVSVLFRKREGVSHETFFGHWQTVHADLAVATHAFQNHILRYAQHHQTPEMKERARSLGENVLDYDGCAQLWVRSWDDWMEFYNSEEYAAALSDDCHYFMELPMTYMVGYENLVVGDASKVIGGKDGLSVKKVWLVTGCSSGFGQQFIPAIIARGDQVVATARNTSSLENLWPEDSVRTLQLDVTSPQEVLNEKAHQAISIFGHIDVVVNNAGYVQSGVWEEISHEQLLNQFNTNVFGPLNVTRAFLPHMRARNQGSIVFMSSISGWLGVAAGGPYSASKFALEGAVESLQKEVSSFGIETLLVVLGQFRTNILSTERRKLARQPHQTGPYDEIIHALNSRQADTNGKQPGDPGAAVQVILDAVRREGKFEAEEKLPLRLVLGSDAVGIVRRECEDTLRELGRWECVARSTDIPGMEEAIQEYR